MAILGMPSGGCRRPLGKMTKQGIEKVLQVGRTIQSNYPEIFKPVEDFFDVDIESRLNNPSIISDLTYNEYS